MENYYQSLFTIELLDFTWYSIVDLTPVFTPDNISFRNPNTKI